MTQWTPTTNTHPWAKHFFAGHAVLIKYFTPVGEHWPLLSIAIHNTGDKYEFRFSCDEKGSLGGWWIATSIPNSLIPYVIELIQEYKKYCDETARVRTQH